MPTMTRGKIQDLIGKLAGQNSEFRSALVNDPKGAIER